jgi:hypothetical protein
MALDGTVDRPALTGEILPPDDDVEATQHVKPSIADTTEKFLIVRGWFRADADHSREWRAQAKKHFGFRAGDQWEEADKAILRDQDRPDIVFNRVLTMLKAVAGMEINGRHEIQFLPRNTDQTEVNELLSAASKWMSDGCDGEDEESQAFEHCLTCGMGWTENRLDYEDEPSGQYIEESIDPLEMYWDKSARKKNLTDARRMHRVRRMPYGDAKQLFPGYQRFQLDATWVLAGGDAEAKSIEEKRIRSENADPELDDLLEVTIVQTQWWERETYWLIADEQTNTKVELTDAEYRVFSERMKIIEAQFGIKAPPSVKMTRKVYKQAFLGSQLLGEITDAPIKGQFSWACITGELDRNKGTFFGLVHIMRDPQMWANKWLSQSLHILNSTAKGGILAETNAFKDQRQAEETYARPDAITWLEEGALSGQNPKLMAKPGAGFTDGHVRLMEFAITALRDVTGINLELLGLKDVNQPGILEAQRKQAGMTVLATVFDSLRRFRKLVGRKRLYFIQTFFADGRLIRVVGQDGAKAMPLLKDKCLGTYDVVVDDAPTSPNQKEANWGIISMILPMFREQLAQQPELLALIMEYSPLPQRLVDAIKKLASSPKPPSPAEQLGLAKLAAEVAETQALAGKHQADAGLAGAKAQVQVPATAVYDMAVAENLTKKNDSAIDTVREAVEAAKKIGEMDVDAAKVRKTDAEASAIAANVGEVRARTLKTHVETARAAIEPVPEHEDAFPKPKPVGAK